MANLGWEKLPLADQRALSVRNMVSMVQNNRQLIRLFFLLVIVAGLVGGWLTRQWVQVESLTLAPTATDNRNWGDLLALIGEQTIQLFLGLTSGR